MDPNVHYHVQKRTPLSPPPQCHRPTRVHSLLFPVRTLFDIILHHNYHWYYYYLSYIYIIPKVKLSNEKYVSVQEEHTRVSENRVLRRSGTLYTVA